jgi:hypothetical protein
MIISWRPPQLGIVVRCHLGEGSVLVGAPGEHERPTTGFQNGFEPLNAGYEAAHDRPPGGRKANPQKDDALQLTLAADCRLELT